MNEFPHSEVELSKEFGVSRGVLENLRRRLLTIHKHWDLVGNTIRISKKGRDLIEKELRVTKNEAAAVTAVQPNDETGSAAVEVRNDLGSPNVGHFGEKTARVVRKFRNPRVIEVQVGEKTAMCRVSDSMNFVVGMEIPVRDAGEPSGVLECSKRAPRFPGRW